MIRTRNLLLTHSSLAAPLAMLAALLTLFAATSAQASARNCTGGNGDWQTGVAGGWDGTWANGDTGTFNGPGGTVTVKSAISSGALTNTAGNYTFQSDGATKRVIINIVTTIVSGAVTTTIGSNVTFLRTATGLTCDGDTKATSPLKINSGGKLATTASATLITFRETTANVYSGGTIDTDSSVVVGNSADGATLNVLGAVQLSAANPLSISRPTETLTVRWPDLRRLAPNLKPGAIQVREPATGLPLVSQDIDLNGDGVPDELVFQANFAPDQTRKFLIEPGQPARATPKVFGRLVPERKDDFAWESDHIAFRMYGQRLEDELVSSGVDVWCKRTRSLIVDRWYKLNNYHKDMGEGLDCYSVGPARGCGGTAILKDGKLHASRNFTKSRIIAGGPIRFIFELTYEPWEAGGLKVAETKRITLDAGQNLNRFDCTFTSEPGAAELPVAIGLQQHGQVQTVIQREDGWMRVWEATADKTAGKMGVGLVIDPGGGAELKEALGHALAVVRAALGKPVVFFAGAGWEKSGDFPTVESWDEYLSQFARSVRSPVRISISKQ